MLRLAHCMLAGSAIALMANTGSSTGAPPAPKKAAAKPKTTTGNGAPAAPPPAPSNPANPQQNPKPASDATVDKTLGLDANPPTPKQSKDGPEVQAAQTPERDGEQVTPVQVAGIAPAVEHVDGEDPDNGDAALDPALAVEPGQAIDQSGGNPVAQNLTTAGGAIDVSPRIQANGRYAEAGPDHGDLPPDPTMASEAIHAKVQEVREAAEEGVRNVEAGRKHDADRQRKAAHKGGHKA